MNVSPPQNKVATGSGRIPEAREFVHENLGEKFQESLSEYDTQRRVETLIDGFLKDEDLRGKQVLDVGCGLGFFSRQLVQRGAEVTACDLGENLVNRTRELAGCNGIVADALALSDVFGENRFDYVVSSECIEHTPNPLLAVKQMCAVLKPGGTISLSTPNKIWWPAVKLASLLKLRPFDGYENFSTFGGLKRCLAESDVETLETRGLHLFPFQFGFHSLSRWCDGSLQIFNRLMINLCVLGRKRDSGE